MMLPMTPTTNEAPRNTGPLGLFAAGTAVDYLGPATVRHVAGSAIDVELGDGRAVAVRLALTMPYQPAENDVLLVIGGPSGHYVIGVLHGTGQTSIAVPGDLDIRAVGGSLRLGADKGVVLEGDTVEMRANRLQVMAGAVVEKFDTLFQRVREMLSVRAGQRHTVVDGASIEKSKNATILTEETATINGKQIHLG